MRAMTRSERVAIMDRELARWESAGRPGAPNGGIALSRMPGRSRRGLYRAATGGALFEPNGHILAFAASPDGTRLAVQVAKRADEVADLVIVDLVANNTATVDSIACRYEPMLWDSKGARVSLVGGGTCDLTVDAGTAAIEARELPAGRWRLFPGSTAGILVHSTPGQPTRLLDRASGTVLAHFPAVLTVAEANGQLVVNQGRHLTSIDSGTGDRIWQWGVPSFRITALATHGRRVLVAGVEEGSSTVVTLLDGKEVTRQSARYRGEPVQVTEVGWQAGEFTLIVEGPLLPPIMVTPRDLDSVTVSGQTQTITVTADDGADLTVTVTSNGIPGPLILTCYGGFGIPSMPTFEPTIPAWLAVGGSWAVANVRGGGEHGTAWRTAGYGRNKKRSIDDLTCIARALVAEGFTRRAQLILVGSSHGGVLAASAALGSDICAGVVATAAPLDLLNLAAHPLGDRWRDEFGADGTADSRAALTEISPLHRAQALTPDDVIPRFLGIILEHDTRVAADDTERLVALLRARGGEAEMWRGDDIGHGTNHLEPLHRLGLKVLEFAAATAFGASGERSMP